MSPPAAGTGRRWGKPLWWCVSASTAMMALAVAAVMCFRYFPQLVATYCPWEDIRLRAYFQPGCFLPTSGWEEKHLPLALEYSRSDDVEQRWKAVLVLIELKAPAAASRLAALSEDESERIRYEVAGGGVIRGGKGRPLAVSDQRQETLLRLSRDPSWIVRGASVRTLASTGNQEFIDEIGDAALHDGNAWVRYAAMCALIDGFERNDIVPYIERLRSDPWERIANEAADLLVYWESHPRR